MKTRFLTAAAVAVLGAAAPSASATILGATVADASSGNYTLTSVSVTRGAAGTFTYVPSQLTGVDLTDVGATGSVLLVENSASLPAPGTRAALLEDGRLDTGVINPVSTSSPVDFSFEVTFAAPVVNSDGEDIVIFEVGSGDPTRFYADGNAGQVLNVTAANFTTNLLTGMPITLYAYNDPAGGGTVDTLAELETSTTYTLDAGGSGPANVAGIGLDLSAFGVPAGASVNSLRFQTTSTGSRLDPVLIVGLPAVVPEPGGLASLAIAAAAALLARRRGRRGA